MSRKAISEKKKISLITAYLHVPQRSKHTAMEVKVSGYRKVAKGSEADLQDAVAQQPVAVGVDASHPAFRLYKGGVYDFPHCTG